MYNTLFTICDGCGKTLEGKQGTHTYKQAHLQMRSNQITIIEYVDGVKEVTFIDTKDNHYLHFCDGNCFQTWAEARAILRRESQKRNNENWDWGDNGKI